MPKMNLSRTYVHAGQFYGPGNGIEVPEDAHKDIKPKEDRYAAEKQLEAARAEQERANQQAEFEALSSSASLRKPVAPAVAAPAPESPKAPKGSDKE